MNIRTLTESDITERLAKWGHTEISVDYSTYRGINSKCRFIDKDYGEWWAYPSNVLRKGSQHPKRGHAEGGKKFTLPLENVRKRLAKVHGDTVSLDETTYVNSRTKARFVDKVYGEFWIRIDGALLGQKHPMRANAEKRVKLRVPVEQMKDRLYKTHGKTVTLDESTYKDTHTDARFIHSVYGEWFANPYNVLKGHSHPLAGIARYKETMKRLYGAEHPSQSSEINLRMSQAGSRRVVVKHWKTGEEVICHASYEYAVTNELNRRQLDYDHQIRFQLSQSVYYCDFYIKDWDLYVETKGWMRPRARVKWNEFCSTHPNSSLWMLEEVKDFTGKTEYRLTKDFRLALLKHNESHCKNSGGKSPLPAGRSRQ